MPAARREKRLGREEREESLLVAASKIVADRGAEALTMEGLAAEAGINKALPYRFFPNRDAVLVALWDRETEAFDARIEAALADKESLEDKLHAILGTWLDLVDADDSTLARLDAPGIGPPELERRRHERTVGVLEFFATLFREEYRISHQDAITAAAVLASGAPGLAALKAHTGWSRKRLADTFVRLCIGALDAIGR